MSEVRESANSEQGESRPPQRLPLLAGSDDYEPCNVAGVNGSGEWERCLREKGHEGPHMGMGSD